MSSLFPNFSLEYDFDRSEGNTVHFKFLQDNIILKQFTINFEDYTEYGQSFDGFDLSFRKVGRNIRFRLFDRNTNTEYPTRSINNAFGTRSYTLNAVVPKIINRGYESNLEHPTFRVGQFIGTLVTMERDDKIRPLSIGDFVKVNDRNRLVRCNSDDNRIYGIVHQLQGENAVINISGSVCQPVNLTYLSTPTTVLNNLHEYHNSISPEEMRSIVYMQGFTLSQTPNLTRLNIIDEVLGKEEEKIVYPPMKCACCSSSISHPQNMEKHLGKKETLAYLEYCKSIGSDPLLYCCGCYTVIEESPKALEMYAMMLREFKMLNKARANLKNPIQYDEGTYHCRTTT